MIKKYTFRFSNEITN